MNTTQRMSGLDMLRTREPGFEFDNEVDPLRALSHNAAGLGPRMDPVEVLRMDIDLDTMLADKLTPAELEEVENG